MSHKPQHKKFAIQNGSADAKPLSSGIPVPDLIIEFRQ